MNRREFLLTSLVVSGAEVPLRGDEPLLRAGDVVKVNITGDIPARCPPLDVVVDFTGLLYAPDMWLPIRS